MTMFGKLRARWGMARYLVEREAAGDHLVAVPHWLADEIKRTVWLRKVEHASDKWAGRVADIPVTEWQAAMNRAGDKAVEHAIERSITFQSAVAEAGRHRAARPRRWPGSKVLPVIRTPKAV